MYNWENSVITKNTIILNIINDILQTLGTDHLTCRGGYGFLFHSEFFFRTTRELEYLIFLLRKVQIFFPEFNIMLYDKISESDYFFFLHQNQNIFFINIGNQNIFFRKKTITPPPPSS
jgi:hypothetical protein